MTFLPGDWLLRLLINSDRAGDVPAVIAARAVLFALSPTARSDWSSAVLKGEALERIQHHRVWAPEPSYPGTHGPDCGLESSAWVSRRSCFGGFGWRATAVVGGGCGSGMD